MITKYYPEESQSYYGKHYASQAQQSGNGYQVFAGAPIHVGAGVPFADFSGNGIGSLVKGFMRSAAPIFKSGAKALGKQLLRTGASIASDALEGRSLKASATDRFKEAGGGLLDSLTNHLANPRSSSRPRAKRARKTTKGKKSTKSRSLFRNVDLRA